MGTRIDEQLRCSETEMSYYLEWEDKNDEHQCMGFDTMFEAASYLQTVLQEDQDVVQITLYRKSRRR